MRPRRMILCVAMACIAGVASPAVGADKCFQLPGVSGGVTFALESFSVPSKGRCKPIGGFSTLLGWVLSGTACTQSDGTGVRLAFSGYPATLGPAEFRAGCTVPLPALTGGTCHGSYDSGSTRIGFTSSIDLSSCSAAVP